MSVEPTQLDSNIEDLAQATAAKFGSLHVHVTEGGWCIHVFRDRQVGCKASTLLEGLVHVNDKHFPGEIEPHHNEEEEIDV